MKAQTQRLANKGSAELQNYIAVDIGASSGRLILAKITDNNQLALKEIHRFSNGFDHHDNHDYWNVDYLVEQILQGLVIARQLGVKQAKVGIDTWAVDYVLLGANGDRIRDAISYRDNRTAGAIAEMTKQIPAAEIFKKTGIQFLDFNTLYQLFREEPQLLAKTEKILLMPDYLGYRLTGKMATEVTNASTTQLVNWKTRKFDSQLLDILGISSDKFAPLVEPGTVLGAIKPELSQTHQLPEIQVITVATHDTASAVVGTPGVGKNWAFLSSGTWSLLGKETRDPVVTRTSFENNYTNEGGVNHTYRFLKNIMGLWMAQRIQSELTEKLSFSELARLASLERPFQQFIDVNDDRFVNPQSMIDEIKNYCRETNQAIPETAGQLMMSVYSNLALCYANELNKIGQMTGAPVDVLNIVGGGSNIDVLNQMTSSLAQIPVISGPNEATAIGNVMIQMINAGEVENVTLGRQMIANSFTLGHYQPADGFDTSVLTKFCQFLQIKRNGEAVF